MKETVKVVCSSCGGTGLYRGFAEAEGCAVICQSCDGTGGRDIVFERFAGRKKREGVRRVFQSGCGHYSYPNDTIIDGKLIGFSQGGCSYEEFLQGAEPKPVKDLYCPYSWTSQRLESEDVNGLYDRRCKKGLERCSRASVCAHCADKAECWRIFEGVGAE